MLSRGRVSVALICLLILAGCSDNASTGSVPTPQPQPQAEAVIFAASSLQDAFKQLALNTPDKVSFNFGGSSTLVTQLQQGAQADVFASADARTMKAAIEAGAVVSGTHKMFATNRLVVVTPPSSATISALADLARPGLKLVLAEKSVPAGNYSLQALDKLAADAAYGTAFKQKALANVVSYESNVRQVLSKVQLGEADAGIVYVTDVGGAEQGVGQIEIPDAFNIVATYYIAPVKGGAHPQVASRFVEYVLSEAGQKVLRSYGFGPLGSGR